MKQIITRQILDNANWVCNECGFKYGEIRKIGYPTFHMGKCDVCLEERAVTESRDYNYLRK